MRKSTHQRPTFLRQFMYAEDIGENEATLVSTIKNMRVSVVFSSANDYVFST